MANCSVNYASSLIRMFSNSYSQDLDQSDAIMRRNVYMRRIELDISNGELEVPVFLINNVQNYIRRFKAKIAEGKIKKLVINLGIERNRWDSNRTVQGADTLLSFLSKVGGGCGWLPCKIKDTTYYGNCGIILDKDLNVIIMTAAKLKFIITREPANSIREYSVRFSVSDPKVYVNPQVFINDDIPINKSISRKAIGYFLGHDVIQISNCYVESDSNTYDHPQVIIEDKTPMFKKVPLPNENATPEHLNECLEHNLPLLSTLIEDIFNAWNI